MKKLIIVFALGLAMISPAYAQEVTLSPESKAELIAELQEKISILIAQLLVELQKELTMRLESNQTAISEVSSKVDTINSVVAVSVPRAMPKKAITLGEPVCRESNVRVPIVGEIPQSSFSWMTYVSQNDQPQTQLPKRETSTSRAGIDQFLELGKWTDTYTIHGEFGPDYEVMNQTITVNCF